MSDLLTAAAEALKVPESLVQRSAAARAAANGTADDDVLSAWAGGAPVAAAASTPAVEPAVPVPTPTAKPEEAAPAAPVAIIEIPQTAPAPRQTALEPEEESLEPVPLRHRIRTASKVGAWAGAALGLLGFLVATAFWAGNSTLIGEGPYTPVVVTSTTGVVIGAALVSVVFGAIVAGLSRSATGWANPGMRLSTPASATVWMGAIIGLVLGVIAGALLANGVGTTVEGDVTLTQLPVLSTLAIMAIGGAVLGGLTAAVTQAVGIPVALEDGAEEEIRRVKGRLTGALSIPMGGLILLLLLVLPVAWALIQSNHLTDLGAPIVGILVAGGILAFASLAGNRPNIRLSFGEVMVAVIGIGTVLIVILAVLFARSSASESDHSANETKAGVVQIVG